MLDQVASCDLQRNRTKETEAVCRTLGAAALVLLRLAIVYTALSNNGHCCVSLEYFSKGIRVSWSVCKDYHHSQCTLVVSADTSTIQPKSPTGERYRLRRPQAPSHTLNIMSDPNYTTSSQVQLTPEQLVQLQCAQAGNNMAFIHNYAADVSIQPDVADKIEGYTFDIQHAVDSNDYFGICTHAEIEYQYSDLAKQTGRGVDASIGGKRVELRTKNPHPPREELSTRASREQAESVARQAVRASMTAEERARAAWIALSFTAPLGLFGCGSGDAETVRENDDEDEEMVDDDDAEESGESEDDGEGVDLDYD